MICVCDIETTGLKPWSAEILTAYFIICNERLEIIDEREFRFKPVEKFQWSSEAAAVHNISWDDAQLFPNKRLATSDLCSWLESFKSSFSFVCHALPFASRLDVFDYQHLFAHFWLQDLRERFYQLFPQEKVYSTITKARKQAETRWNIRNQKLSTWSEKLGIKFNHHTAADDAKLCLEVYRYQREVALNGMA